MAKIIVGLSGGVDSAVACKLLLDQGFKVEAAFMKNWEEDDTDQYCSAAQDLKDAKNIAHTLGIKLHTVNFATEYWQKVFKYFLKEFERGRTPNPDVLCNKEIKFKEFLNFAQSLGASKIATGHYARIKPSSGAMQLKRGKDVNKDQSYFLHLLSQYQLAHAVFPLGELTKPQVRALAKAHGFEIAHKKDSTGICFIGKRDFRQFLSQFIPAQKGEIKTSNGELIGEHIGLMFYTLGQRKGLQIGGHKNYPDAPWYVLKKDLERNELIVGQNPKDQLLASKKVEIEQTNWINRPNKYPFDCLAQTRYRQQAQSCRLLSANNKNAVVEFTQEQYAITPGQSLVFYLKDECLGGGTINANY